MTSQKATCTSALGRSPLNYPAPVAPELETGIAAARGTNKRPKCCQELLYWASRPLRCISATCVKCAHNLLAAQSPPLAAR